MAAAVLPMSPALLLSPQRPSDARSTPRPRSGVSVTLGRGSLSSQRSGVIVGGRLYGPGMDWLGAVTTIVVGVLGYVAGGGVSWLTTRGRIRQRLASDVAAHTDMPDVPEKLIMQELIQQHVRQLASEDSYAAKKERQEVKLTIPAIYLSFAMTWDAIATPYPAYLLIFAFVAILIVWISAVMIFVNVGRARAGRLEAAARGEAWTYPGEDDPPDRLARWGIRKQEEKKQKRAEKERRRAVPTAPRPTDA